MLVRCCDCEWIYIIENSLKEDFLIIIFALFPRQIEIHNSHFDTNSDGYTKMFSWKFMIYKLKRLKKERSLSPWKSIKEYHKDPNKKCPHCGSNKLRSI